MSASLSPSGSHGTAPPSPSLTHASSNFDALDEFLDWSHFPDSTASGSSLAQPQLSGTAAIDPALIDSSNAGVATSDWPQMNTRIVTDADDRNGLLNAFGESLFPESKSSYPFATVDPNFMAAYGDTMMSLTSTAPSQPAVPALPSPPVDYAESPAFGLGQEDDDMEEAEPEPVARVTRAKGKGRAKTASSTTTKAKRTKVTAVKDLELPLPASDSKPVIKFPTPASLLTASPGAEHSGHNLPHIAFPVPDYVDRPSAEEYKKMNSKEKRQLRNKISARNFRHRRKEYITTLEEEIASRDGTIAEMSEEMRSLRSENVSLRADLDALKKTFESMLEKAREGSPTASTPSSSESSSVRPGSSSIIHPNLRKDVSANWGPGGLGGLGLRNDVGVHSAMLPSPYFSPAVFSQRNMNPRINALASKAVNPEQTAHLPHQADPSDGSFFGANPYAPLANGNVERYRSTMYNKIAHNLNGMKTSANGSSSNSSGFRPSFFASLTLPRSNENDENIAPLASPTTSTEANAAVDRAVAEQTAYVANVASTKLVTGLLSCFWSTFSDTGKNGSAKDVADLLAGRAELRVVPKEGSSARVSEVDDGLLKSLSGLTLRAVTASGNVASFPSASSGSSASSGIGGPMKSDKAGGAWI